MSADTAPEQVAQTKGECVGVIGDLPNPDALCDAHVGTWTIAALYQFRVVSNLPDLRNKLQVLVNTYPLCGTLILAEEGAYPYSFLETFYFKIFELVLCLLRPHYIFCSEKLRCEGVFFFLINSFSSSNKLMFDSF